MCGRPSVGKGISALRWLVVAPMCAAYLRGFVWPLALMPFARFRSLPIASTRGAGSLGFSCSGGFNRLVASVQSALSDSCGALGRDL